MLWVYILGIPLGIIGLLLIGFCIWNMFLILSYIYIFYYNRGKTTREKLKKLKVINNNDNDFDWCQSDDSLFDIRSDLTEEDA